MEDMLIDSLRTDTHTERCHVKLNQIILDSCPRFLCFFLSFLLSILRHRYIETSSSCNFPFSWHSFMLTFSFSSLFTFPSFRTTWIVIGIQIHNSSPRIGLPKDRDRDFWLWNLKQLRDGDQERISSHSNRTHGSSLGSRQVILIFILVFCKNFY